MGRIGEHPPVMLVLAAFSRHPAALAWARDVAESAWGPVALASPFFSFVETDYYTPTMGPGLRKVFFAFQQLIDPAQLPAKKKLANQWENIFREEHPTGDRRPLNLDPGYLSEAKLVLASTKDHNHRIYLSDGIFAEVTLHYQHHAWRCRQWTFPDYRRLDYHEFFTACRQYLREHLRKRRLN